VSQRNSGYARKERDLYETPDWVTDALIPHIPRRPCQIWDPACASGKMVRRLRVHYPVCASDVHETGDDFLMMDKAPDGTDMISTNPPYEDAQQFIEHALRLMEPCRGLVAMLLRCDFDHAKKRAHLFRDCPAFAKKLALTKRIAWFLEANGKPKASPSFNHAWFIWDRRHDGAPTIAYGPVCNRDYP
jgi:hypothetical protein